jgi:hypothetical protein
VQRRFFLITLASLTNIGFAQPPTNNITAATAGKEPTMSNIETEEFTWGFRISNYNLDAGSVDIETLINDCWFADARGIKRQFYGSTGQYGVGAPNIGGNRKPGPLPKTLHLQYYDYPHQ